MKELIPTIIQDARTGKVLMLGYSNEESLAVTKDKGLVTFYSRSKQRLWTKGETSGNHLKVQEILTDCDNDAILIKAIPLGPTCHTGADTCFGEINVETGFLFVLEKVIKERRQNDSITGSYVAKLFKKGTAKIAQKVGEEGVEVAIEAVIGHKENLKEECADLLFHLLVLLIDQDISLTDVISVLSKRHDDKKHKHSCDCPKPDAS